MINNSQLVLRNITVGYFCCIDGDTAIIARAPELTWAPRLLSGMEMSLESGNNCPGILVVIAPRYELVCTSHRQTNLQSMSLYSNRGELSFWLLDICIC